MAVRRFKSDLSQRGIDNLIRELENYRDVTLQSKLEDAINQLLDLGISIGQQNVGQFGSFISFTKKINPLNNGGCTGIMLGYNSTVNMAVWYNQQGQVQAEVSSILMAEFGSGVYADSTDNIEGIAHRGTFPEQTHAFQRYWKYATALDAKGNPTNWVTTSGIEPTAPMYKAGMQMLADLKRVTQAVFTT